MATRPKKPGVAELRARNAELERERELLNAIANHAPSLLCLVDADGRVRPLATNIAFERTLGYDPSESGGDVFWELYVPADDAAAVREAIEETIRDGTVTERDGTWLRKGGEAIHVAWSCTPLPMIESGPVYLICGTDITERKRHEEEVRTSRSRIVAAADDARRRLERNLHDGAQQRPGRAAALAPGGSQEGRGRRRARTAARRADRGALGCAAGPARARPRHPPRRADEARPPGAVRVVADRAPLPVELSVQADRYSEPVEATAYYVVAEALTNVAKYAQASKATVRIAPVGECLIVDVEDDGVGGADASAGTGLRGLADRVAARDGVFTLESEPGSGTHVHAEIPHLA